MAKFHLDRLRDKYNLTGQRLQKLMNRIIEHNNSQIAKQIYKLDREKWIKELRKVTPKEKRLVLPDIREVIPQRSVFTRKAVIDGTKITDTLKTRLDIDLRNAMNNFTKITGEQAFIRRKGKLAGTINPKIVKEFEKSITGTFKSYVKKDPRYNMPTNIHNIAVTEVRGTINEIQEQFKDKLKEKENIAIKKMWRQNRMLAKAPRIGHSKVDGKIIKDEDSFKVPRYKKIKGKWLKIGFTSMRRPHDETAPLDQIIGCNCDVQYFIRRKK